MKRAEDWRALERFKRAQNPKCNIRHGKTQLLVSLGAFWGWDSSKSMRSALVWNMGFHGHPHQLTRASPSSAPFRTHPWNWKHWENHGIFPSTISIGNIYSSA